MDELITMLTEKTGLPEDKARMAVDTVIGFLKQRLPSSVGEQLTACLSLPAGQGFSDKFKEMAHSVGGVFSKKAS
ncbi:MAG TPA: hypothetical protein VGR47_11860 [Terracidiphilus sp.]|nr:hypothetical protein [Terracidiphilus sp.]